MLRCRPIAIRRPLACLAATALLLAGLGCSNARFAQRNADRGEQILYVADSWTNREQRGRTNLEQLDQLIGREVIRHQVALDGIFRRIEAAAVREQQAYPANAEDSIARMFY